MLKNSEDIYDVTIIGGGPAGLFASFYAGLREMKVKIIEAHPRLGGKLHVYPQKMIWDVGGMTPLPALKLIEQLTEQALTFEPTLELGQTVTQIKRNEESIFELETDQGTCHYTRTIIMAIGSGGVIRPIKLDLQHAELYESTNLYYSVQAIQDFKDKTILISGGGPSAVDWANDLAPMAKEVFLIYRGQQLKAHEADLTKLAQHNVQVFFNTEIIELKGDDYIRQTILINNQTEEIKELAVQAVLINHGFQRDHSLFSNSALEIELIDGYLVSSQPNGKTTIPGLYAAGDCIHYDGKLGLIAGAFQDAANAVNRAKLYIDLEANQVAMVSSHNKLLVEKNKQYLY